MKFKVSTVVCCAAVLALSLAASLPGHAAGPIKRLLRKKTSIDKVAAHIAHLERELDYTGSITAKTPDVWGQARLTQHRQEFEKQMALQLTAFNPNLNAEISVSDQAFLAEALTLAATVNQSNNDNQQPLQPSQVDVNTLNNMVAPINGTRVITTPDPNATPQNKTETFTVIRTDPFGSIKSTFGGANNPSITLEPEILLDQRKRFLNHLHEIRRINEGDDTADAPGYSLNLVRIPVSILPGDHTREGYGAEITVTATSHLTEELLPQTFRALVINDLVDQLSYPVVKYLSEAWPYLLKQEQYEHQERALSSIFNEATSISQEEVAASDSNREDIATNLLEQGLKTFGTPSQRILATPETVKQLLQAGNADAFRRQVEIKTKAPPGSGSREAAEVGAKLSSVKRDLTLLLGSFGQRARRSRFAIPPTQLGRVFGEHEITLIANEFYKARDRRRCNWAEYLTEVQSFIRQELDASYEYLTHKQVYDSRVNGPVTTLNVWESIDPALGQQIRSQVEAPAVGHDSATSRIPFYRANFFRAIHNEPQEIGNFESRLSGRRSRPQSLHIQQAAHENTTEEMPVPMAVCPDEVDSSDKAQTVTEALAWALVVESVLLNERLNEDLVHVSQDPNCGCQHAGGLLFYGPNPPPESRLAFMDYVRCRWPIHVFALDPETQQQNVADSFSLRREAQLAIALAFTRRFVNTQSLTRYMRRIEMDMRTISLNNTIIGFGHGDNTFGWRFTPRIQTPPLESNGTVIFRDLIVGGPNRDALLKRQRLESGPRECVAIVVMPSFVRHVKFDTRSNWFRLSNHCMQHRGDSGPTMDYVVDWSRDIRKMQNAVAECIEDQHLYRDGEVERLMTRVEQLSQELPMQTMHAHVPYENTLGGFEMFSSGVTDLAPELIGFYGVPGIDTSQPTQLFLVGNHFSVHDTRVMAGNKMCEVSMLSRQVMQVTVPAGVRTHKRRQFPPQFGASANGSSAADLIDAANPSDQLRLPPAPMPDDLSDLKQSPHQRIPCDKLADFKRCPKLCDPCCNSEFVEIRLATPYGVASSLEVPVVSARDSSPQFAWEINKLQITYYHSKPDPTTGAWEVQESDIRIDGEKRLAIVPQNGLVTPNSGNVSVEYALLGLQSGVRSMTSTTGLAKDVQNQKYFIEADKFVAFHTNLKDAVVGSIKGTAAKPPAPPPGITFNLKATVLIDHTRVSIAGDLPVHITFVQR